MIVVPKELQIQTIEGFLNKISEGQEDIVIPVIARTNYFGALASAIQFVNTWARTSNNNKLIFQSDGDDIDSQCEVIAENIYKISAALMANSLELRIGADKVDIKRKLYLKIKDVIDKQNEATYGNHRGNLCSYTFVDHSTKGFIPSFYNETGELKALPRSDEQISNIVCTMIDKTFFTAGGASSINPDTYEAIGFIFSELFMNTHEHGSRAEDKKVWVRPGVRTLFTKTLNMGEVGNKNMTKGANVLSAYIDSLNDNRQKRNRYLELGIVDSGLGYYKRWKADHPNEEGLLDSPSIESEYNIFEKCFTFKETSSHMKNKGNGLAEVMDRLTKLNGFMKVRSGRLALYRDFKNQPYTLGDESELYDWSTEQRASVSPTVMAEVTGVSITLLIPLGEK